MKRKFLQDFWHLFHAYWRSEEKWGARGILAVVVVLTLGQVYLLVQLNNWNNDFYNALQNYAFELFWPLIGQFSLLAFIYIFVAVYAIYLRQKLQIRWRTWMTHRYLESWMARQVYYRLQVMGSDMDNPDQRISEDISQFVSLTLQLALGFLKQLTTLAAFAVILWELSGLLTLPLGSHEFTIHGYMLWLSVIYAVVGTWLAHKVGRRLIRLNYDQQRFEADFRFDMMRVRENSESIAFYGGEAPETAGFQERFSRVIKNFWGLMRQTKLLNFYVNGYGQCAIIFPILLAAPRYFSGGMQLGGLIQTLNAFGQVQGALSYFVDSYDSIAQLVAVIRRLNGFTRHMEEVDSLEMEFVRTNSQEQKIDLQDFAVALPDGRVLLADCNVQLLPGRRLLVTGGSGCGKSTLLRALAGIWPFGHGTVKIPADSRILFLPQRPYLPLGSLRRAIYYPQSAPEQPEDLAAIMEKVGMGKFTSRLDETDDWSRILSLGEQQRIAFARVLLFRPQWVFLDEATSALDEPREQALYELLRQELPAMGIVSVGHRSTLLAQHDEEMQLDGQGAWQLHPIQQEVDKKVAGAEKTAPAIFLSERIRTGPDFLRKAAGSAGLPGNPANYPRDPCPSRARISLRNHKYG